MRFLKKKVVYIFLFLCVTFLHAQQPVTIQITEKDGLPDIEFYDVLEDRNGFIWLAADKGLYRYDGKTFLNYTHPEKRGLSVFGLFEDSKGNIWCNTISGQFFYIEKGEMHLFTDLKDELKGQLPEFVIHNQHLIAFSEKGVFKINLASRKRDIIKDRISKLPYYGYPFFYEEQLYFVLSNQIKKFTEKGTIEDVFTFERKIVETKNNAFCKLDSALFFSSYFENRQHFFVKTSPSASFVSIKTPRELLDKTIVRVVYKDALLWFCTNQGVIVCSWDGKELRYQAAYLTSEYITKMIKDKNNNFWFTSLRNGVFVMPNIYVKKVQLQKTSGQITAMESVDKTHLVYGTTEGEIGILNEETLQTNSFRLPSSAKVSQILYNEAYRTVVISQESQSYLWNLSNHTAHTTSYFTASKGMAIAHDNALLNASYDRATLLKNPFSDFRISDKELLFQKPRFISDKVSFRVTDLRMKRAYTCLYSKVEKSNYVGFVDELIRFDSLGNQTVIRHKNQPIFAIDMEETKDGTLWVSTFKDGILGIKNQKVICNYTTVNGLLSNQTGKLKSDGDQLWLVTDQGVQVLDVLSGRFKNLTKNEGLESYAISDIEIASSQVFLSSNKGLFVLDKEKSFKKTVQPILYFTGVSIQEKDTVLQSEYTLDYDKNAVKIGFNANGFQSSESIVYQYRLLGLNDKWLSLEKGIDFVRYSSLPSGNFVFEVKAVNQNGIASAPISMKLSVNAPFWQKWWFYVLVSLLFVSVFWMYFRTRLKRAEKEKQIALEKAEIDKELVFSQLENLRSQMNPHFIFNALNSIQEYIVTNEKETASAFLVKFSRLIRIYLEHSRESEVQLEEELKALRLYLELEKDRFEDALEYTISVDENLDTISVKIPSLFLQPYIENALKHGLLHKKDNRILTISFTLNDKKDGLLCTITDNGIGREASAALNSKRAYLHKSFATSANAKRIELINKTRIRKTTVTIEDLHDENNKAQGTRVAIFIPF